VRCVLGLIASDFYLRCTVFSPVARSGCRKNPCKSVVGMESFKMLTQARDHVGDASQVSSPDHGVLIMDILAIDLGKFNSMCCFFNTRTQEYSFWPATTTRQPQLSFRPRRVFRMRT
jgi:hypothetical protein